MSETDLWSGKPFNWGFPSFTTYRITDRRIIVEKGIFTKRREEILLHRVRDVSLKRNLIERILKFGDITLTSTDATSPICKLRNVRGSIKVADILSLASEDSRIRNRALELTEIQA